MPGVEEDLPAVAVDTQHASNLPILLKVEGIVPIKLGWVGGGFCARDVCIQIFLGKLYRLLSIDSHLSGYIWRGRVVSITVTHNATPHHAIAAAHHLPHIEAPV